jgi:hypothetical protein
MEQMASNKDSDTESTFVISRPKTQVKLRQTHFSQYTLIRTHRFYHDTITIGINRQTYDCNRKLFHPIIPK